MKTDPELWRRIEAVELDELGVELPFSARLARDNGWSRDLADAVIEEYCRFCYLAVVAGHEVTPSDEVDQAWHLHLTYSRHYWGPFTQALGRPLHHGPTEGGPAEQRRYLENYDATLVSYAREFGRPAPARIWPAASVRFGDASYMRRINSRQSWVIPRPGLLSMPRPTSRTVLLCLLAAVTAALWTTTAAAHDVLDGKKGFELYSAWFSHMMAEHPFTLVGGTVALVVGVVLVERSSGRPGRGASGCGASCSGGCGGGCGGD
jgi:hypothetical protein